MPGVGLGGGKSSTTKKAATKNTKASTTSMKNKSTGLNTTQPATVEASKKRNKETHNTSAFSNPSIDEFASKGSGKYKMLKH